MATTTTNAEEEKQSTELSQHAAKITDVYIRLMFVRIGEIDTLNEKYQAQASIEARWVVDLKQLISLLPPEDQQRLTDGKSVTLDKYENSNWHPQLYIENALGDLKQQIRYSAKKSQKDNQFYICEHRDIKGVFWEKLELQHFPSDVQDLSISVASLLYDDRVVLLSDSNRVSGVNREAFVDQQEWSLYKHVDMEQRHVTEFLLRDEEDEEGAASEDRKRSVLTVTCHAARQSNYFYWNGYFLIFLITVVSFCIYGIPANAGANRIQISCTLLLTSITFRWTVNRSLPTISYLTSMDIYAIVCIFTLVAQCIWHAVICAIIFLNTPDFRLTHSMWFATLDQFVFIGVICVFIILHVILITWLYMVPFRHRKNMSKKDEEYTQLSSGKKKGKNSEALAKQKGDPPGFSRIPMDEDVNN